MQCAGDRVDRQRQAAHPQVGHLGLVGGFHPCFAGDRFFFLGAHRLDQQHIVGPLRNGCGQLCVAPVDQVRHAKAHPPQHKGDQDVDGQHDHQRPHQPLVIAGNAPQHQQAGVRRGKHRQKNLHDQGADAGHIGGDAAEQFLGVVGLIELQRQMHDLFPHHPPQVPVDPRQAQVACQAGNGADHQRQQRKKQVGQHDGEKAHLAGEQRGAVFGRADAHIGDEGRYRQIPHDPEIRQPRLAQHDKKAPETAVPLAEQCVLFHLLLPSLSGHTPESKRDPPVLRARRAR